MSNIFSKVIYIIRSNKQLPTQLKPLSDPLVETRWLRVDTFLTLHCFPLAAQTDVSVVTLFCTQEHGLLLQDCFPKPSGLQALLALDVPYYYFSCKVKRDATLHASACSSSAACVFITALVCLVLKLTQLLFRRGSFFRPEVSDCPLLGKPQCSG